MLALGLVLVVAAILSILLSLAALARSGLRGHPALFFYGIVCGACAGLLGLIWDPSKGILAGPLGNLELQIIVTTIATATGYCFLLSLLLITLTRWHGLAKRRGDLVAAAAGIGLGFGITTTLVFLSMRGAWPPSALITALTNAPMQVAVALLIGSAFVVQRQKIRPGTSIGRYAVAFFVQVSYQFVIATTESVGHWLAWLEPVAIGWLWLGLIVLFWIVSLAVMAAQSPADVPQEYLSDARNGRWRWVLSPWVWFAVALIISIPALMLIAVSTSFRLDIAIGRVMILVLLAVPLMTAAILWRTGLALRLRRPGNQSRAPAE